MGCAACHQASLRVDLGEGDSSDIRPYTDLLLHNLGSGLADRDVGGTRVSERWRTAPLWGMHAAYVTGQPLHLLHDGRASSVEEAILWHDAEGRSARERYVQLPKQQRQMLIDWIESL
jgi:CxxC motif-containing protein (DUF1111 family)